LILKHYRLGYPVHASYLIADQESGNERLGQPNMKTYDSSWTGYGPLIGVLVEKEA
jgi:hypothetical protein